MAAPLALLTALALAAALAGPARAEVGCLGCHSVHRAELGPCVGCHGGHPGTHRQAVAHAGLVPGRLAHFTLAGSPVTDRGVKLLDALGCRRCHGTAGRGNRLAADLDRSVQGRAAETLAALGKPAQRMPDFRLADPDAEALVNALLLGARQAPPPPGEVPTLVHLSVAAPEEDPFTRRCGPCHRALTPARGALGTGRTAPDLSGLFTPFYPGAFREGEPWTPATLEKWLENPRRTRPWALMAPVRFEPEGERAEAVRLLGGW